MTPDWSSVAAAAALVGLLAVVGLAAARNPHSAPEGDTAPVRVADAGVEETAAARALREGRRIMLNEASARDLQMLPGIGPALSERIVAARERDGPFPSVDSLRRVPGVGRKTIEGLRSVVRID